MQTAQHHLRKEKRLCDAPIVALHQDMRTAKFLLGAGKYCHVILHADTTGKDIGYINSTHATIIPDPDTEDVEIHNVSATTTFKLSSLTTEPMERKTVRSGSYERIHPGTTWQLQLALGVLFNVYIPCGGDQTHSVVTLPTAPSKKSAARPQPAKRRTSRQSGEDQIAPMLAPTQISPPSLARPKHDALRVAAATPTTHVYRKERGGQVVAVKKCRKPELESSVSTWEREYRILDHLRRPWLSPHIANLIRYDAMKLILELEFIGPDLGKRIDACKMSTIQPATQNLIWHHISQALVFIHKQGITHCDIKAENVLLTPGDSRAVLCDFGCGAFGHERAHSGGTPRYIAPEYATANERGLPGDIWAFGVTMMFVLRLIPLPVQPGWDISKVPREPAIRAKMFEWIGGLRAVTVPESEALVKRMLEVKPRNRITAAELVEEVGMRIQRHLLAA
ncbi:kinase-like protein [Trematosphaeria pertusa]|uniref:Kinase-like protein n=1 Tax=Trematosphaeria pertusa TaxID=390896 RepID=A0A6A6HT09_9PLEO|nr:kinase-like protein [Trematosphaeria pertusa]KAF2240908.1 kinase-like protein [Trematosphaeria pertusa]